jgi:hypothetical protein
MDAGNIVAIAISLGAAYYSWKQARIAQQNRNDQQLGQREYAEWFARASNAVAAISKFYDRSSPRFHGRRTFLVVFQDDQSLCRRIETYLIRVSPQMQLLEARTLTPELLGQQEVRQTITDVEKRFDEIKRTDELLAKETGLL